MRSVNSFFKAVSAAVLVVGIARVTAATGPTAAQQAGMAEYWRHAPKYGCLACSVYVPAPKAATVPRKIGSLPVLEARLYDNKARLACFCADRQYLWAADDSAVYQIDARRRKLVRTFTVSDSLPDVPIRQLVADGPWLWIVGRGRLARLDISTGKIKAPDQPAFSIARLATGPAGTILVTDRGAYRWNASSKAFESLGVYPGQRRLAQTVKRGFWQFQWHKHRPNLLRDVVIGQKEFYVLAGNTLSRFNASTGRGSWSVLAKDAWRIVLDEPYLWAVTTAGLLRYDCRNSKADRHTSGAGPAPGRPIDLAVTGGAVYLLSEPRFQTSAKQFAGGGVSRFDPRTGDWSTTSKIGEMGISFTTAAAVDGAGVLVAVRLAGAVEHRSLHPGMASTRRYLPKITGLAIAVRPKSRPWKVIRLKPTGGFRWVMGQGKSHHRDVIRPQRISQLLVSNGRLWAAMENFPEKYYGGYYPSVQCIARKSKNGWVAAEDRSRLKSLGLVGEQPALLCLTATHGSPTVLAHGQRRMLGLLACGGTVWVVHEGGVFAYDASKDAFQPVLTEKFRAYWQVTAAAADPSAVWFGTDAGTIARYDRRKSRFRLLGVIPGRKVTQICARNGKVWVRTAPAKVALPASLSNLTKLPAADIIQYDGRTWSASSGGQIPDRLPLHYKFRNGNYLFGPAAGSGQPKRLAFLKGVFQPKVLCAEDPRTLWVKVWGGVGRVSLPASADKARPREARTAK